MRHVRASRPDATTRLELGPRSGNGIRVPSTSPARGGRVVAETENLRRRVPALQAARQRRLARARGRRQDDQEASPRGFVLDPARSGMVAAVGAGCFTIPRFAPARASGRSPFSYRAPIRVSSAVFCDLEHKVFASRLNSCIRKSSLRPAGASAASRSRAASTWARSRSISSVTSALTARSASSCASRSSVTSVAAAFNRSSAASMSAARLGQARGRGGQGRADPVVDRVDAVQRRMT